MTFISHLQLFNFRCYESARIESLQSGLIVITGPNGAGKTNILEAVSLLSPGRGLRSAKVKEIQKNDAPQAWAIASELQTSIGMVKIGTGLDPQKDKRIIRINGETLKSQAELSNYIACIWLTPQMDRLFLDPASGRRRFLDKLVFTFDPGHSGRSTRYENAMAQRSKLLREGHADPSWLKSLELQMAETGVAIAAARLDFTQRLQIACDQATQEESNHFPKSFLQVTGALEELLQKTPAIEVEELFAYQLEQSRRRDSETGGAATGPHKSDLSVTYRTKDMPADQCSTGEQKALLIGLILAHARLMVQERGINPILLLDEIVAHLDENRRAVLFDLLLALRGQVWMTGTDDSLFSAIAKKAHFFHVENAQILPLNSPLKSVSQKFITH